MQNILEIFKKAEEIEEALDQTITPTEVIESLDVSNSKWIQNQYFIC